MRPRRRATELLACLLGVVLVLVVPGGGAAANPIVSTPTSGPQQARTSTTLRIGSEGYAVKVVQLKLASYGFSIRVDGIFGPVTEHRVRLWQGMNNLRADGTVGPLTLDSLGLTTAELSPSEPAVRKSVPTVQAGDGWHDTAISAGWPENKWPFLSCVINRESGGDPTAYNGSGLDDSHGLTQLNTRGSLWGWYLAHGVTAKSQLFDPYTNLHVAWLLYQEYPNSWGRCG